MGREWNVPRVLGSRFPVRMRALDNLDPNRNRFGDFNFSIKIINFRKILENPWKSMVWAHFGYPGWMSVQISGGVGGAREIRKSYAGRRHGGQKLARNVSSDVPATF